MALSVTIDPADRSRLVFSQPVTLAQAIAFLWALPPTSRSALRADPTECCKASAQRRFIIDTADVDALLGLRQDLMNEYVSITPIQGSQPPPIPGWIPVNVREQILGFSLPDGTTRFPGTAPWGAIVVWVRHGSYMRAEVYQEFPTTMSYYLDITQGDQWTATLLLSTYTQYNTDMRYFVEQKGLSPSEARSELSRINNEVLKLVLEGAVAMMSAGSAVTATNNAMRAMAPRIIATAERTASMPRIRPLNGQVNVGGGFETPDMTNLNPIKAGSGGPAYNIPNHVRAPMEAMDDIFEPGSVDYVMSSKVRFHDFDWPRAAQAAANVMRRRGTVFMNVWCSTDDEALAIVAAFKKAGFESASAEGHGPGTIIHAVR
jgi:hypothetical protein